MILDILPDRGFTIMQIAAFDGSTNADTIFSFDDWWLQYAAMYTGNVNATNTLAAAVNSWQPQSLHIRVSTTKSRLLNHFIIPDNT